MITERLQLKDVFIVVWLLNKNIADERQTPELRMRDYCSFEAVE